MAADYNRTKAADAPMLTQGADARALPREARPRASQRRPVVRQGQRPPHAHERRHVAQDARTGARTTWPARSTRRRACSHALHGCGTAHERRRRAALRSASYRRAATPAAAVRAVLGPDGSWLARASRGRVRNQAVRNSGNRREGALLASDASAGARVEWRRSPMFFIATTARAQPLLQSPSRCLGGPELASMALLSVVLAACRWPCGARARSPATGTAVATARRRP